MATLGISLIAHNEAIQLEDALKSTLFADDIVLVDCESTDGTPKIAGKFPRVRLFNRPNDSNLNINKSFGFQQLTTDWIFYLDPDERIPDELIPHLRAAMDNPAFAAFRIPRKNHFFGKWLQYGGQYPDYQIRLFKNGHAKFPNQHVHESLKVNGEIGLISEPFDHFPYPDLSSYLRKMNFYTTFQAEFWRKSGKIPGFLWGVQAFLLKPLSRFFRRYFFKRGFLDCWPGYIAALGDAFQAAVSYAKFLEMSSPWKKF